MTSETERLKIAMLGHKRIPSREGGIEVVVEALSTRMAELGHEVTCFNRKGHHSAGAQFDGTGLSAYKNVKLRRVFTIDKRGLAALTASIFAAVKAGFGNYDVVHFHAEGPCAMLWFPKLLGKRCVATIHGLDWKREKWKTGFGARYIKLGEKVAVRYADEIIVLSEGTRDYFRQAYGRETVYIPNGVDRPVRREADLIRSQYGLEKDGYILYLGRIVPEKGLRYLIEAYKRLDTDKKLVIAGGPSDTDAFLQEVRELAGSDRRILFTGFVSGRLLEELYSNAYLYTLPSDLEGMPLSLLEAMSCGSCCLVSDIAECTEVVQERAVVFHKGDVADLTRKLQRLCDDRKLVRRYRAASAEAVCKKYNWDDVVDKTLALYRGRK